MREFITEMLLYVFKWIMDILEFFFQRKKKKQRKFEKENNLPESKMVSPYEKLSTTFRQVAITCITILIIIFTFFKKSAKSITTEKIIEIQSLLEKEKEVFGMYPKDLEAIKRGSPLNEGLLVDGWNTMFEYRTNDKNSYILVSLGKDGTLGTEDDISID